jgi:hypothetical protein
MAIFVSVFWLTSRWFDKPVATAPIINEITEGHPALKELIIAAEKMVFETPESTDAIATQALDAIRETFWQKLNTPLKFAQVSLFDNATFFSVAAYPETKTTIDGYNEFLRALGSDPELFSKSGFDAQELARLPGFVEQKKTILSFMNLYGVGLVMPCTINGQMRGIILLGQRQSGKFSAEEKATLQRVGFCLCLTIEKHLAAAATKTNVAAGTVPLKSESAS